MSKNFSFVLCCVDRTSVSLRFGFRFAIGFRSVVVCVVGFRPGPQPSPARPDLGRAPLAPPPLICAPPSLSHFVSRPTTSSHLSPIALPPLFHLLCPRCDPVGGCRDHPSPKVSPHLPLSFPLLSLLLSSHPRPGALATVPLAAP
jgi:hypothetical protein